MSRYVEPSDYEGWEFISGRWEINVKRAFAGKRGQRALKEIELALLSLSEPKLYAGNFCQTFFDVDTDTFEVQACVLGAWAYHRKNWWLIKTISDIDAYYGQNINDTAAEIAEKKSMSFTMAWELIYLNDEKLDACTPEDRYERILETIRSHLPDALELYKKTKVMGITEETFNQIRKEMLIGALASP